MTAFVKVFGCRSHDGGAADTGPGVRKPSQEETPGGVERPRVKRYRDFGLGVLLLMWIERSFWEAIEGATTRSSDRDRQNRRRAARIDRRGGCPWWRDGEHGHRRLRVGAAEVQLSRLIPCSYLCHSLFFRKKSLLIS